MGLESDLESCFSSFERSTEEYFLVRIGDFVGSNENNIDNGSILIRNKNGHNEILQLCEVNIGEL